jgi:hypothetical protein
MRTGRACCGLVALTFVVYASLPSVSGGEDHALAHPEKPAGHPRQAARSASSAVTTGRLKADFNGDGFADLAVGAPGEDIGPAVNAGSVNVLYACSIGLVSTGNQQWYEGAGGILGTAEGGDFYGYSAAAGDFNADGFSDLAVGIPGKSSVAGAVNVLYGSAGGLTSAGTQVWEQGSGGILDSSSPFDQFGISVATGDINGDGYADLVVGAAGEAGSSVNEELDAGAFHVIFGSPSGLTSDGNELWSQDSSGILDSSEEGDFFANSVAVGDFNHDGFGDVAASAPLEDFGRTDDGAVNVIYGSADGLTATGNQLWSQDSSGIAGTAADGDTFGFSLASGDMNGDGFADLAIGVPGDGVSDHSAAGAVNVIYGSDAGLASTGNQRWHQNRSGIVGVSESGDQFGFSVAIGDLNADGNGDLAVGVNLENISRISNAGLVDVIYGSAIGLTSAGSQQWYEGYSGILGSAEKGDFFGFALVIEDFGGGPQEDLAVSAPGENLGTKVDAGVAQVIYGESTGLSSTGNQLWDQDSTAVVGVAEDGDAFGFGLADGETLAPVHR